MSIQDAVVRLKNVKDGHEFSSLLAGLRSFLKTLDPPPRCLMELAAASRKNSCQHWRSRTNMMSSICSMLSWQKKLNRIWCITVPCIFISLSMIRKRSLRIPSCSETLMKTKEKESRYISWAISLKCCKKQKAPKNQHFSWLSKRRRPDLNRWILVLQTIALPLGYCAVAILL